MMTKISVVIATYNGEKYIEKELESIRNQSVNVDEVLIGDDGSTDKTVDIVSDFINKYSLDSWKIINNKSNLGLSGNFINLLSLSSGDLIFVADQDDEWTESKVETMKETILKYPNILCLSSSFDIIDDKSVKIDPPKGLTNCFSSDDGDLVYITPEELVGHSLLRGCTMCVRKEVVNKLLASPLKEHLSTDLLCHDWAISMISSVTGNCVQLNRVLMHYRVHGANTSLENLDRIHMKRKIARRINGLDKSIKAHSDLLQDINISTHVKDGLESKIKKQIEFENSRLSYLKKPSIKNYLKLVLQKPNYNCYYHSKIKGWEVLLGDLIYVIEGRKTK